TQNTVISHVALPEGASTSLSNPNLVESHGKLYYTLDDESMIGFVELPVGDWILDVSQQALTDDGKMTISVLGDGSRLQLRSAAAKDGVDVLAEAQRRKPYWVPELKDMLVLDRTGRLVADREGSNVVTIREVATLRQTATVTAVEPPEIPPSNP